MATEPKFASTPRVGNGQVSTANTNRDGSGTLANILQGAATGTKIVRVSIVATGTTTAGVVRLFIYDGTNNRLLKEILVDAITPSTSIAVFSEDLVFDDLVLPDATWILKASTNNAETFNVIAFGADF